MIVLAKSPKSPGISLIDSIVPHFLKQPFGPNIVCVFPEPVWPKARILRLYPCMNDLIWSSIISLLNISSWENSGGAIKFGNSNTLIVFYFLSPIEIVWFTASYPAKYLLALASLGSALSLAPAPSGLILMHVLIWLLTGSFFVSSISSTLSLANSYAMFDSSLCSGTSVSSVSGILY